MNTWASAGSFPSTNAGMTAAPTVTAIPVPTVGGPTVILIFSGSAVSRPRPPGVSVIVFIVIGAVTPVGRVLSIVKRASNAVTRRAPVAVPASLIRRKSPTS